MKSLQLSINLHHYTERHGLLIIILLGEVNIEKDFVSNTIRIPFCKGIISMVTPDVAVEVDQYMLVFGGYCK